MSTSGLPPIPPTIVQFTGPLLLGHLFNWALFGVLSVQVYIYYLGFPKDRLLPKCLVVFAYILELVQIVLATRDAFRTFGPGWGDMEVLDQVAWIWFSIPVMSSIISFTVQMFFAWRIWILSRKVWIPIAVVIISTIQAVSGIWTGTHAHFIADFTQVEKHDSKTTAVWLGGTALCDVIITVSMIYYLTTARTGFRATNAILVKIVRVTVETGLVCSTFAILDLSLFLSFENNYYHMVMCIALSKLYSNSLLVALNSRVRIVGGRSNGPSVDDDTLSAISFNENASGSSSALPNMHQLSKSTAREGNRGINVVVSYDVHNDPIYVPKPAQLSTTSSLSNDLAQDKYDPSDLA